MNTEKLKISDFLTVENELANALTATIEPVNDKEVRITPTTSDGCNCSKSLVVTKDSLKAYLPYYGRSYSAPVNPSDGGIKFTSKDFSYKQTRNKKGVYAIQIETKDVKFENYRMTINISENGYASLVVSSINKQPITFNGSVDEVKSK